ncbi:MAG: sigma-70 family RNA polymerase sigma factor [Deltaproteobacteria bacterium]|nr:sigma-70 family RNA polymerase sigma factor [Deltaproteobacteria bacterium]
MDAEKLEDLYRRFAPLVHARARRILGDADAEDVVQEVFLRLYRNPPRDERCMIDWIYTTSTNASLDRLRFRRRRDPSWHEEVRDAQVALGARSVEAVLASQDLFRKLLAHVDRRTQEVAVLHYLEEMDQSEMARLLGVSRKTVGERLRRFEKQARRLIGRWNP